MQKVLIIGCGGAGKSTLAKKIAAITNLPLIHLDQYFWKADWVESSPKEWHKLMTQLVQKPRWIMDGNYGGTMDLRLNQADTIIFLDCPSWKCLLRVFLRTLRYWKRTRPDMTPGCKERFSWPFFHYIAFYNWTRKPAILAKLAALPQKKIPVILKNKRQTNNFLRELEAANFHRKTVTNE